MNYVVNYLQEGHTILVLPESTLLCCWDLAQHLLKRPSMQAPLPQQPVMPLPAG